jgi:hypothetical protein
VAEEKDWLFPEAEQQKANMTETGLVFAQKYLVFAGPTSDPRARELLEHWTTVARRKQVPDNASLGELAAHNAFRRFIEGVHVQIEFAQKGQNVPQPRTK